MNLKTPKQNNIDRRKGLIFPTEMSNELAEIVGIHYGDGHMTKKHNYTYKITYSLNSEQKEYFQHVKKIFKETFNINLKTYDDSERGNLVLYFFSKSLCEYFNTQLQIPYSPKKQLRIPQYIMQTEGYIAAFLRGLADTDGCTTVQRMGEYSYNLIKICTCVKEFANDIKEALTSLGIKCYICRDRFTYEVVIRRKKSFKKFFTKIKPRRLKNDGDAGNVSTDLSV